MADQADGSVTACQRDIRSRRSLSSPKFGEGAVCNHRDDGDEGVCGAAEHQCRLGGLFALARRGMAAMLAFARAISSGRGRDISGRQHLAPPVSGLRRLPRARRFLGSNATEPVLLVVSTARCRISPRRVQPDGNTARLSAAFRRPSTMGARKHAAYRSPGTSSRFTQSRSEHSG